MAILIALAFAQSLTNGGDGFCLIVLVLAMLVLMLSSDRISGRWFVVLATHECVDWLIVIICGQW